MKYLNLFSMAIVAISLLAGCSKDETKPAAKDVRDAHTGIYVGDLKAYDLTLTKIDQFSVTLKMQKSSSDNDRIDFYDVSDNTLAFYGNKLNEVSNGLVYDVPRQYDSDGTSIEGNDGVIVGSTKYDGGFFSDTKKVTVAFKMYDENLDLIGYATIDATKQ